MAATGGGKIRSRRYHIASKPYAKTKQQQPGLITRVTDTVKSIVPSWLQKYFNNGQPIQEGEVMQDTDVMQDAEVMQDTEQNSKPCPPPPPNGSEEGPPPIDGRDSPEPRITNTEPSTSRASLNFQENALARPPLNRSRLHFSPLDASSSVPGGSISFPQPSTSSAPGPFSTGFSLVKEIKDNLSQHEDDNISTTSGFSSRASEKDVPTSKTASIPQLWSPEIDRTLTGPQSAQSSLKKPAFNLSVFGTSANSSLISRLGDSPYYPGKTTYGGASATKTLRSRPSTPYQAPIRRQIKAKPAGAQPCGVTSATARRILQSLERMSSPLADAKRIPSAASSPMSVSMDGTNLDFSHPRPKKKRLDSSLPPVQKLTFPTAASVSWNRSMSFRPSLTPGGVGRSLDRTLRDTPTRQLSHIPEATLGPSQSTTSQVYPMSSTPVAGNMNTGGGKMKRERTSTRPSTRRPEDEEQVTEVPDLPPISLPISSFSLPTFTFSAPSPTTSSTSIPAPRTTTMTPAKDSTTDKESSTVSTPPCVPFTFSSPIVKATDTSPSSFSPSAGFTFSAPVAKLGSSMSNGKLATSIATAVKSTTNDSTEEFEGPFKPAKTLKQGSVLDLLKAPGFASPSSLGPVAGTHQSSTESNNPTSTSKNSSSSSTGFGDLFKPPAGSLNCNSCLVQNKPSDTKRVSCVSPKPSPSSSSAFKQSDSKQKPTTSFGVEKNSANNTASTTTASGYGAMLAKSLGTWECDTCLVQNKAEAIKCVACETVKLTQTTPSAFLPVKTVSNPAPPASSSSSSSIAAGIVGFGDKFKKPEGAWECSSCLVENKALDTKCVACMSSKPGATTGESSSAPPAAASSVPVLGFGDKFKKPENSWECEVCCVVNTAADLTCVACQSAKPGAKVEPKAFGSSTFGTPGSSAFGTSTSGSGGFKFGLSSDSNSGSGEFKFGGSLSDSSSLSSGGFKFGVLSGSSLSETNSKDTTCSSGFKFGGSTEGFKFGVDSSPATASDNKKSDQPSTGSGFKFGASSGIAFGASSSSVESNSSKGGFTFGLSKPEDKITGATALQASSVTFSVPTSSEEKGNSVVLSNDTTASTTTTTSAGLVFSRLGEPSMTTATPPGSPTFRPLATEKEPAAPMFTFGKPEKKEAAPSSFLFSSAGKEAESTQAPTTLGGFPFSKPDPPKENPPPPTFTFGKPADKSETTAPEVPKPPFTFGQSAADTTAPKSAFSFNAATTSSSSSSLAPSLFGTGNNSIQAPVLNANPAPNANPTPNTFVFGQAASSSSDPTPAKTFVFGQSQDNRPPSSTPSMNSTPAPAAAQPFMFGAPANGAPTPAPPPFTFEATVPSAASTSAPSAAPSPFVFSSASSGGFAASKTPSFGNAFGSQAPAFGVKPNAAPIFGQQPNSTPVFGASNNSASGGGFQFGGASAFGAVTNNTGVFAFGAGTSGFPAPSATHPIAPQPAAPGGGFNFSQTPTFNVGSNKSSFTSSSAGQQTITGRKIKMAVRRRK